MNEEVQNIVLNLFVAGMFILCFLASLSVCKAHLTLPVMALRRAGRIIWSDTPFVNFFFPPDIHCNRFARTAHSKATRLHYIQKYFNS